MNYLKNSRMAAHSFPKINKKLPSTNGTPDGAGPEKVFGKICPAPKPARTTSSGSPCCSAKRSQQRACVPLLRANHRTRLPARAPNRPSPASRIAPLPQQRQQILSSVVSPPPPPPSPPPPAASRCPRRTSGRRRGTPPFRLVISKRLSIFTLMVSNWSPVTGLSSPTAPPPTSRLRIMQRQNLTPEYASTSTSHGQRYVALFSCSASPPVVLASFWLRRAGTAW